MKPFSYSVLRPVAVGHVALSAAVFFGSASMAVRASDIIGACDAEIASYCAAVEPGHGRLAACLYAHEDKLGDACDAATGDHGDMLDIVFEEIRFVSQECAGDIRQHCAADPESGGVFGCLQAQGSLSDGCATVIERLPLPSD